MFFGGYEDPVSHRRNSGTRKGGPIMKRSLTVLIFCIFAAGLLLIWPGNSYAIDIDGYLGDWGVTPGPYGASDWTPTPNAGIVSVVEDQHGGINTYLGPGLGGQAFDAEAVYYTTDTNNIYVAIVTGQPATGLNVNGIQYYPGDISFDYGTGKTYGLETMGTNMGELYKNPLWSGSPYWGGVSDPTCMIDGTGNPMGQTEFVYLHTYYGSGDSNDHWVMEMRIPKSYFGSDWNNSGTIHWTESCGNDAIDLCIPKDSNGPPITPIPEPASMSLIGLGLAGLLLKRKKRVSNRPKTTD